MCLYPRLTRNPKYKPTKKNGGNPPVCYDTRLLYIPAACGECYECRKKKQREYQVRLQEEIRDNPNAIFVTLTISDESFEYIMDKYQIETNEECCNKSYKTMSRKSTKINRKIRKALVYYRTRTRENRKIACSWNSMGLGEWKESNGQLEIRNHIHRIFCE